MPDMSVNLAGMTMKNPVVVASGTFGFGREYNQFFDLSELGGICAKGLTLLPREPIARQSIENNSKILLCDSLDEAIEAANRIAPEHLEICTDDPFAILSKIKNAGSIFLGKHAPEALGDYFAGPNHTLPTSGTARFSSPLGVDDFVKKSQFIYYTRDALEQVAQPIAAFAREEGLEAHARSVTVRFAEEAEA